MKTLLDQLKATLDIADAATPGPWDIEPGKENGRYRITYFCRDHDFPSQGQTAYVGAYESTTGAETFWKSDARFTSEARTTLPATARALIVAIKALEYAQGPTRDVKVPRIREALAEIALLLKVEDAGEKILGEKE